MARRAGWQGPILAGDPGPPERHVLRGIAKLGDLAHVNGQARVVTVSPAAIDAMAAFEVGTRTRKLTGPKRRAIPSPPS